MGPRSHQPTSRLDGAHSPNSGFLGAGQKEVNLRGSEGCSPTSPDLGHQQAPPPQRLGPYRERNLGWWGGGSLRPQALARWVGEIGKWGGGHGALLGGPEDGRDAQSWCCPCRPGLLTWFQSCSCLPPLPGKPPAPLISKQQPLPDSSQSLFN